MRTIARKGPVALVFVLALAGLGASPRPSSAKDTRPAEVVTELGRKLDEAIRAAAGDKLWGTVLVAKGGEIVLSKGYGFADYRAKPNAPDTLFELASASKQVTATAILRLEQQKKLATSDPLSKFFKDLPADKRAITLDHLLHHTAGFSPELGVPYAWVGTRDAYVKEVLGKPLVDAPGAKFAYSNVGYALLAAVVEVVTGRTFEDYVRKELFATAGLSDTGFIKDERLVKSDRVTKRACDDCQADWTAANWWWGWGYRGMGGVVSTALDVLAWDRALRGEKVLGAPAKAKLYAPDKEHYACGWKVESTERGTTKASHSGGVRGYAVEIARWLEEDVLVVILSNGKSDLFGVERAITDLLFAPPTLTADLDVEGLEPNENGAYEYAGRPRIRREVVRRFGGPETEARREGARDDLGPAWRRHEGGRRPRAGGGDDVLPVARRAGGHGGRPLPRLRPQPRKATEARRRTLAAGARPLLGTEPGRYERRGSPRRAHPRLVVARGLAPHGEDEPEGGEGGRRRAAPPVIAQLVQKCQTLLYELREGCTGVRRVSWRR